MLPDCPAEIWLCPATFKLDHYRSLICNLRRQYDVSHRIREMQSHDLLLKIGASCANPQRASGQGGLRSRVRVNGKQRLSHPISRSPVLVLRMRARAEACFQMGRSALYWPMSLPPSILFVTESFGVGGTESHLLALLPELKAKGFDVRAFCFTERGSRAGVLEAAGIPVVVPPALGAMQKRSPLAPFRIARGAAKLLSLIRRWRPSIVHFFLPGPYLAGAPVAIAAGVPIKLMSRRSLADYRERWPGTAQLERLLHRRMDAVLGNSRAVVEELIEEGCPESQVHLIYNGVRLAGPDPTRAEARARLGLDEETFVAIVVANLLSYKGHLELIASLAMIGDRLPKPWTLLCAGRNSGSGNIARAIAEAGLGENVRLLGERSDIPLLLRASDIGVLAPTRNEGFSNAVLESMAAGLPMAVTDIGGNAEAVIHEETGFVVPARDPAALAAAILRLAHDPDLRRSMGQRARRRAAEHFSLAASVEKYCDLYDQFLASGNAARERA
jgi:glycosyltransferase involved in cell wall biosynthesis